MALSLIKAGYLKTHLYNVESRIYTVEDFHKIYCMFPKYSIMIYNVLVILLAYLFASFDKLWIRSKPNSVMEFSHIRDKFEAAVVKKLQFEDAVFRWDPYLETI